MGFNLQYLRAKHEMSTETLARLIGISERQLRNYTDHNKPIPAKVLIALKKVFPEASTDFISGRHRREKKKPEDPPSRLARGPPAGYSRPRRAIYVNWVFT